MAKRKARKVAVLEGDSLLVDGFARFGGRHVETAALKNVLAQAGAMAPHTGEAFSDALLFGIGGGIGAGYFVYASGDFVSLFVPTQTTAGTDFLPIMARRLGATAKVGKSSSASAAEKKLRQALAAGRPYILWIDPGQWPYPGTASAYYPVVVYGWDEASGRYLVSDRSRKPLQVERDVLLGAWQGQGTPRLQGLEVTAPRQVTKKKLQAAVKAGLEAGLKQLEGGYGPPALRANFSLKALEKWADLLTDAKDKRGWAKLFAPGPRLYDALFSGANQIDNRGDGGAGLRALYADFLDEAAEILRRSKLRGAAELYRASAKEWGKLSAALMPAKVPEFKEARQLAAKRRKAFERKGDGARGEIEAAGARLAQIKARASKKFPLSQNEVEALLDTARKRVLNVQAAEAEAAEAVRKAMK